MRWLPSGALAGAVLAAAVALAEDPPAASDPATAENAAPAKPPITSTSGSVSSETLQQRLERFKREKGAGSDKPFDGFASQAEQEAERRRREAIGGQGSGGDAEPGEEQAVENRIEAREAVQDKLLELADWGGSGCVEIEPAWNLQDDFIKHRRLNRGDFMHDEEKSKVAAAVQVSGSAPSAFAAILFSCEVKPVVQQASDGRYVAALTSVRYYAVLSRKASWWNPDAVRREDFLLGHQQLHFDMANELANWLTKTRDARIAAIRGVGRSPEIAIGQLQLAWGRHMLDVGNDFDVLETAFDRDTVHGGIPEKQTQWAFKLGDGLEALAKGLKLAVMAGR
jgi:hypothetical protein